MIKLSVVPVVLNMCIDRFFLQLLAQTGRTDMILSPYAERQSGDQTCDPQFESPWNLTNCSNRVAVPIIRVSEKKL